MENPAGVRRGYEALEKRRFQAIRLLDEGLNHSEAARRVKVAMQTVVRWVAQYREYGKDGCAPGRARQAERPGSAPRSTSDWKDC